MGTTMLLSWQAFLNSRTMRSRSAGVASIGTRSLSCRFTPQAPISPSTFTISLGGKVGRTASPKGSRPRLPSVHNPKENLCSGFGWYGPLLFVMPLLAVLVALFAHELENRQSSRSDGYIASALHIGSCASVRANDSLVR